MFIVMQLAMAPIAEYVRCLIALALLSKMSKSLVVVQLIELGCEWTHCLCFGIVQQMGLITVEV